MFKNQIIDTYNVFLFSKFTFPQSRQHIIISKTEIKIIKFCFILECIYERFKNVLRNCLEY